MTRLGAAGLLKRIAKSKHSLTIHFPPVRPVATGTLSVAPVSPLTGAPRLPTVVGPITATPTYVNRTGIKCLWLEAWINTGGMRTPQEATDPGWLSGADVMARVNLLDALVNVRDAQGETWFDRCETVELEGSGKLYKVLKVTRVGASFESPHSANIWLVGTQKQ